MFLKECDPLHIDTSDVRSVVSHNLRSFRASSRPPFRVSEVNKSAESLMPVSWVRVFAPLGSPATLVELPEQHEDEPNSTNLPPNSNTVLAAAIYWPRRPLSPFDNPGPASAKYVGSGLRTLDMKIASRSKLLHLIAATTANSHNISLDVSRPSYRRSPQVQQDTSFR